jgi:5-carboxymethyl-2-hydroxymuconate isomerase
MALGLLRPYTASMPHLILEYSANLSPHLNCAQLLAELHAALMELEAIALADIKSRVLCHTTYRIGDGDPRHAFVHLNLALLGGRDVSVRQHITDACLKVLHAAVVGVPAAGAVPRIDVSVEVREMERATYAKLRAEADA